MKKMDVYPPLQAIKDITQSIPSIWEDIAQAAENQRKESLWRSDIYITSQCLEKEVLERYYRGPEGTASMTAAALSVLASWRRCKEVYRFAPEMERLLYQQANCTLPINVLLYLPYACFYIETPQLSGDRYHGFFVSLDQATDTQTGERIRLLRCFACDSADGSGIGLIELPLEEGRTLIDEIIPAALRAANLAQISLKEAETFFPLYILKMMAIITRLSQLILYITAQNADVREHGPSEKGSYRPAARLRNSGPVEIKDRYREIRGWDVGYRIVYKMAAVKREQAAARGRDENRKQSAPMAEAGLRHTRMPPVPHLRCGHWQTFWTGRREPNNPNRKLLLKWIAPTFVNCGHDPGERLPMTINQYQTERQLKVKGKGIDTGEKEIAL